MTDIKRHRAERSSYLTGYLLALVLTAIPFSLVLFGGLSRPWTDALIAFFAVAQIVVHLRYFLHIDLTHTPRENLLALALTALIAGIMAGGSVWIMASLSRQMAMGG